MKEPAGTLLIILAIAFAAPALCAAFPKLRVPALVLEILLGIIVGPDVLDLVAVTEPIKLLSDLGLAALIFMAGFELDPDRLRGKPLELASAGWGMSILLGFVAAVVLQATDVIAAELFVGLALTTTALGALVPILRDAGLMPTPFGTHVMAVGSVGEFGPIIAIALVLSGSSPSKAAGSLAVFAIFTVVAIFIARRPAESRVRLILGKTLRSSGQLYVRLSLVLVAGMAFVATELGLDFLLGAFTAGVLYRLFVSAGTNDEELEVVESKLEAVSFGYVVPIFFVTTGITYDLDALVTSPTALLKLPLFLALFLVVRGLPVILYRHEITDKRRQLALAFFSATALPLVVAITTLGVEAGQMRSSTAAAMVGAGMISIVVYPLLGMAMLRPNESDQTIRGVRPVGPGSTR